MSETSVLTAARRDRVGHRLRPAEGVVDGAAQRCRADIVHRPVDGDDPAGGQGERTLAEVRWCHKIDHAHYRIGTRIKESEASEVLGETAGERVPQPIGRGPQVPSGAEFRCPACKELTTFSLIGLQSGTWETGVFPLYQCASCSSTRSIVAILSFNRHGF